MAIRVALVALATVAGVLPPIFAQQQRDTFEVASVKV